MPRVAVYAASGFRQPEATAELAPRLKCFPVKRLIEQQGRADHQWSNLPYHIIPCHAIPPRSDSIQFPRTASLTEENNRLRCLVEIDEQARREQERDIAGLQTSRASLTPEQVQSARARLCRTVDDLCGAEEAAELVLTCLLCTRLFRDPQVMTPCGHTLCADCHRGGSGSGGSSQGTPPSDGAGEAQVESTGNSEIRASFGCRLCEKERGAVGRASIGGGEGIAPNHAVQALVAKHTFRGQLLQVLRRTSAALLQDAPRIA